MSEQIDKKERPIWVTKVVYNFQGDTLATHDDLLNQMEADGYTLMYEAACAPGQKQLRFKRVAEPTGGKVTQG
jgi:hypothetical protein